MATKYTDSCLEKAAIEEPIFVLRAQDQLAPAIVRQWAEVFKENHQQNGSFNVRIEAKYNEAIAQAEQMEQWPDRKIPD